MTPVHERLVTGTFLAALLLCGPIVSAGAQDTRLAPGARVRVTTAGGAIPMRTGSLQSLTDTTLVLSSGSSIPLASITRLELSRGRKPNIAAGVVGFLLGGAAGGVLACTANRDDYGVFCGGQDDTKLIVGAALGGAAGAVLGALLFRRERWTAVDPPKEHQADVPRSSAGPSVPGQLAPVRRR
ncbi:MAG TPA: hypothetical protein VFM14_16030 [Gemmatimonadales bacterium]|nr:hypothetical protein [Gemmatimonadales bacterium]